MKFEGIIPALVTPFDKDDEADYPAPAVTREECEELLPRFQESGIPDGRI